VLHNRVWGVLFGSKQAVLLVEELVKSWGKLNLRGKVLRLLSARALELE
jgi:hypothetical protein